MLCSKVARSLSSSSSRRLRSWSPNDRYLCQRRRRRITQVLLDLWGTQTHHRTFGLHLSIISCGPWSIPIPSRSNITASRKASSQNCSWSHSVERSLPEHRERERAVFGLTRLHCIIHTMSITQTKKIQLDLSQWRRRTQRPSITETFWFSTSERKKRNQISQSSVRSNRSPIDR